MEVLLVVAVVLNLVSALYNAFNRPKGSKPTTKYVCECDHVSSKHELGGKCNVRTYFAHEYKWVRCACLRYTGLIPPDQMALWTPALLPPTIPALPSTPTGQGEADGHGDFSDDRH